MARIGVITKDKILFQKIRLLAPRDAVVEMLGEEYEPSAFSLIFRDAREGSSEAREGEVRIISGGDGDRIGHSAKWEITRADFELSEPTDKAAAPEVGETRAVAGRVMVYPFLLSEIRRIIEGGTDAARLTVSDDGKRAVLDGVEISLTEVEGRLLLAILSGRGEYVSREELSRRVWGGASAGLLNVYIHYLREKLEYRGEKIILASRKSGYKIDERFLGGKIC